MMRFFALILFLLMIPIIVAIDYSDSETLTLLINSSNNFTMSTVSKSNNYKLSYVNATFYDFPKSDYRQYIYWHNTYPTADVAADRIIFSWNKFSDIYEFSTLSKVSTEYHIIKVDSEVNYPLQDLSYDFKEYLDPTETFDINQQMRNIVSEIIGNNTDLFVIEYLIADYVRKNIVYDLNSVTQSSSQKSSWVLENRQGVCDELTGLFISLNRAAGIPVRYVSGYAYTNMEIFGSEWVPHAWAEVYFPGFGWIPYDVTYGQYGFLDSTHIMMTQSSDIKISGVSYEYLGHDIKLNPGTLHTYILVLDYGQPAKSNYKFNTKMYYEESGFESYNLVTVDLENNNNFYTVADLYLGYTEGIVVADNTKEFFSNKPIYRKEVLLKPFEYKTVYWVVKINKSLDKDYYYTFPMIVYNSFNETSETKWVVKDDSINYDQSISKIATEKMNYLSYSSNVLLNCNPDKKEAYIDETIVFSCTFDNIGDKQLTEVEICVDNNCSKRNIGIEKFEFSFEKKFSDVSVKIIEVTTKNNLVYKSINIPVFIKDIPKLNVQYEAPEVISYDSAGELILFINKNSTSDPKNIDIVLKGPTFKNYWTLNEMRSDQEYSVYVDGSILKPNKNTFSLQITYKDDYGTLYQTESSFIIKSESSIWQKVVQYVNFWTYAIFED